MVMIHARYGLPLMIALGSSLLVGCNEAPEMTSAPAPSETNTQQTVTEPESESAPELETAHQPETSQANTGKADDSSADETAMTAKAEKPPLAADAGLQLYESNCKVCHAAGLLDAPKYGDTAAWTTRLTKGKETLYMHSAKGFNKMPAQAVNGISEAQVKAAVDYMLASVN